MIEETIIFMNKMKINTIQNILPLNIIDDILHDSIDLPWGFLEGKRTDNKNRIWMHEYDYPSFQYCVHKFQSSKGKLRLELCKDKKGSWLEQHVDDVAKIHTMQIYLTDAPASTYFDNGPTEAKANTGWWFDNTGTELHGLEPLKSDRISIIINYVNDKWRDQSVLC